MFMSILLAASAAATIAGFLLEVWREITRFKKNASDDEGRKGKGQR